MMTPEKKQFIEKLTKDYNRIINKGGIDTEAEALTVAQYNIWVTQNKDISFKENIISRITDEGDYWVVDLAGDWKGYIPPHPEPLRHQQLLIIDKIDASVTETFFGEQLYLGLSNEFLRSLIIKEHQYQHGATYHDRLPLTEEQAIARAQFSHYLSNHYQLWPSYTLSDKPIFIGNNWIFELHPSSETLEPKVILVRKEGRSLVYEGPRVLRVLSQFKTVNYSDGIDFAEAKIILEYAFYDLKLDMLYKFPSELREYKDYYRGAVYSKFKAGTQEGPFIIIDKKTGTAKSVKRLIYLNNQTQ